jgi:ABC-2 type transport system ATP-binding protein
VTGARGDGSPRPVLLRAERVSRAFGAFTAVEDVTMHVCAGEVVGLLGANGAGKTTLLRMLLGLLATSQGSVELLGGEPDRARRRRLGYVPQGLGLYRDLTVRENLAFASQAYGNPPPDLPEALRRQSTRLVGDLPLGQQRQLAFVSALAHAPEVLVLDEPTSGVEPWAAAALWDTIHEQAERGVGVLVTTHNMREAEQCDRLLLMSQARLVAQGSQRDIVGTTTALAVHTDDWARAFAVLNEAGEMVMLAGRDVRVADADADRVGELLTAAGVTAEVSAVGATIEERMLALARVHEDELLS